MAKKMRELLWKLREDTASDISELQLRAEIGAWLDEQSEPTAEGDSATRGGARIPGEPDANGERATACGRN
jgi:hypothetical protein